MRVVFIAILLTTLAHASERESELEVESLETDQLRQKLWRDAPWSRFYGTIEAERAAFESVVFDMFRTAREGQDPSPHALDQAHAIGLGIELWSVGEHRYAALVEAGPEDRGWGTYVVRIEPADEGRETLLQAPHAFHDRYTGRIAVNLFFDPGEGPRPRALFVNTRQRYRGPGGKDRRRHRSSLDVCHNDDHPFSRATHAALSVDPDMRVVQLHGFAKRKGRGPMVIVSAGQPMIAPDYVVAVRDALREFGWKAGAYPLDVTYLGATLNVQGRLVRAVHGAEFLHVEMTPGVRRRLHRDPIRRSRFAQAIFLGPDGRSLEPDGPVDEDPPGHVASGQVVVGEVGRADAPLLGPQVEGERPVGRDP